MKYISRLGVFFCMALFLGACAQTKQAVPAANEPAAETALYGVYEGVLPAADCPGIHTVLTVNADGSFSKVSEYLERDSRFEDKGSFVLENGVLKTTDETGEVFYYQVQPNALVQLDMQGNPIEGEMASFYILQKK